MSETRKIKLSPQYEEKLVALEAVDVEREEMQKQWLKELFEARRNLNEARAQFRQARYDALQFVYSKYIDIEASDVSSEFYSMLREKLLNVGAKIQANTPNEGLVVRTVFGVNISSSQIGKYVNVLRAAKSEQVNPLDFVEWLKQKTISAAANQSKSNNDAERKERLHRARTLVLRYFEWRETNPLATLPTMLAHKADGYVSPRSGLCLMVGVAVRRYDRASDYADIHISHILPPSIDLDIQLVDKWSKAIEPRLEDFEENFATVDEKSWAEDMEDSLWAADVEAAERMSLAWARRQQAAIKETN